MDGTLIAFTLRTGSDRTKSSAFVKKFYGQDSSSHHGRYTTHRKGLLDDIPHRRLIRGVIIVAHDDEETVSEFLKSWNAEVHTRKVKLSQADEDAIGRTIG